MVRALLIGMLFLWHSVGLQLSAQEEATLPPLFDHVKVAIPPSAPALQSARAVQPVKVRWEQVLALQPGSRIRLNLMEGVDFIGIVKRVERREPMRYSCFGELESVSGSDFILVVEEDALALVVNIPPYDAVFDLRYVREDLYVVVWVGEELPCGTDETLTVPDFEPTPEDARWVPPPISAFEPADNGFQPTACVQPEVVLDVAVYYTTQMRQAIGGTNQAHARIQLFIDQTNSAYANSQIPLRARLVRRLEVNYPEEGGGDGYTQLSQLTNPNDGVLDEIHTDRTNYRADQVVLLVNSMNYCGIAWCGNGDDPHLAFNVTQYNCVTFTFAHEIGHNQGCGHDRDNGSCGFRSYGFGWRFYGNDGVEYRTVMAYRPGTRIAHFSNPDIFYQGQPTGVPIGQPNEAHNAQVIRETSHSRETFRLLDVWVDRAYSGTEVGSFAQPFNTVQEGVEVITTFVDPSLVPFPILYLKAGVYPEALTISKRMALQACGGVVVIGSSP